MTSLTVQVVSAFIERYGSTFHHFGFQGERITHFNLQPLISLTRMTPRRSGYWPRCPYPIAKHLALWAHNTSRRLPKAFRLLEMTDLGVSPPVRGANLASPRGKVWQDQRPVLNKVAPPFAFLSLTGQHQYLRRSSPDLPGRPMFDTP